MRPRIFAISVSHKTASMRTRERLAVPDDRAQAIVRSLAHAHGEAVLVRTCGRQELYIATRQRLDLLATFAAALGVSPTLLCPVAHLMEESQATRHLLQVASGLKSPLPGEHHILGQVRNALTCAQKAKSTGPLLSSLFRAAICCGKRVRSETPIGRLAQSYASTALAAVQEHTSLHSPILIVGSGALAHEITLGLFKAGHRNVAVASRHENRGRELAKSIRGTWHALEVLDTCVSRSSVIICCTSSQSAVLSSGHVPTDGRQRVLLDLGMPRNIDARIARLPGTTLIDLQQLARGASMANACIETASQIVDEEQVRFAAWLSRRRAYYARIASQTRRKDAIQNEAAA